MKTEAAQRNGITLHVSKSFPAEFITRFSTLSRMLRMLAYCMRFSHNARNPSLRRTGYLNSMHCMPALR
jgi:hypothetical protein